MRKIVLSKRASFRLKKTFGVSEVEVVAQSKD